MNFLRTKKQKIIVGSIAAVVLIGATYVVAAYSYDLWPYKAESSFTQKKLNKVEGKFESKPAIIEIGDQRQLSVIPVFDTDDRGECTLILNSTEYKATFKSSSKDNSVPSGCLNWNIPMTNLPKGSYDIKIIFDGAKDTGTVSTQVTY